MNRRNLAFAGDSVDILTVQQRSERMRRVRGKDTKPERAVRRIATDMGYRYRLQYSKLPGRPDLAFPGRRRVIWVHGCYWHRHDGCRLASTPKSHIQFWQEKFEANQSRDLKNADMVRQLGWQVLVIWQCETRNEDSVGAKIAEFLGPTKLIG